MSVLRVPFPVFLGLQRGVQSVQKRDLLWAAWVSWLVTDLCPREGRKEDFWVWGGLVNHLALSPLFLTWVGGVGRRVWVWAERTPGFELG